LLTFQKIFIYFLLFEGNVIYSSITDKHLSRQLQSTYQNTRQVLGFQNNIVSKIPLGGGVFLTLSLLVIVGQLYSSDRSKRVQENKTTFQISRQSLKSLCTWKWSMSDTRCIYLYI